MFVLRSFCRATLGKKKAFSKKIFYTIRIVFVVFAVYAVLAGVYFSGSLENYTENGVQSLQIANDSKVNFNEMESGSEINSQLVLFETKDYYYVTDVMVRGGEPIGVIIWNDDTYRFIDKVDCSVKTIGGYLSYIGADQQKLFIIDMCIIYTIVSFVLSITFICLLSVPQSEEEHVKKQISNQYN